MPYSIFKFTRNSVPDPLRKQALPALSGTAHPPGAAIQAGTPVSAIALHSITRSARRSSFSGIVIRGRLTRCELPLR
jgi:hypothetical protein